MNKGEVAEATKDQLITKWDHLKWGPEKIWSMKKLTGRVLVVVGK